MKKLMTSAAMLAAAQLLAFRVATFAPLADGTEFVADEGGKVIAVEAFSPLAASGTVALQSVWRADIFTNALDIAVSTQTVCTIVWSNTVTRAVTTNTYNSAKVKPPLWEVALSSNVVTSVNAVTNTWPVYKETAYATNAIVSGTASSGKYSGAPAAATYIAPGERLVFTGTASGGFLRLILE